MDARLDAAFQGPAGDGAAGAPGGGQAVPGGQRHNLPGEVSPFLGRRAELAELRRVAAGTRLLTLTGAGGVGKTRLALRLAAEALQAGPGAVWLVELAPLADPALVPQAVAGRGRA